MNFYKAKHSFTLEFLPTFKILLCMTLMLTFSIQNLEGIYNVIYNTTDNGGITFTGNTLGLSKFEDELNPGRDSSIGCFISTDTNLKLNNYPRGTTNLITKNSSSAVLDLPPGSVVLHAELIWSGSYGYHPNDPMPPPAPPPLPDVSVILVDPLGVIHSVSANPLTAQESINPTAPIVPGEGNYVRTSDVTTIVKAAGGGTYAAGQIAGTLVRTENARNAAGWTLAVVYQNPNMYTNNMTIWSGCEQAVSSTTANAAILRGFCIPPSGSISARLFVSATEGDADLSGDHMLFGSQPELNFPINALMGINNPINNFFASQINTLLPLVLDANGKYVASPQKTAGKLDTRGTFGDRNHSPSTGNIVGGRQGYDITSIDISDKILPNQTEAFALGTTTSDDYTITALGLQIQVAAPIIQTKMLVNNAPDHNASLGKVVTFSVTSQNIGTNLAEAVVFQDILPPGLSFLPGSVIINLVPDIHADPSNISLSNLDVNESFTISFQATVEQLPTTGCFYKNTALINYQFTQCQQSDPTLLSAQTNAVTINVTQNGPIIAPPQNSVSPSQANVGDVVIYSFTLQNQATASATSISLVDILPVGLDFVEKSVCIDMVNFPDYTPANIPLPDLTMGDSTIIQFQVLVSGLPNSGCRYINQATVNYETIPCGSGSIHRSFSTNQFNVNLNQLGASIKVTNSVEPTQIPLFGVATFTIEIENIGDSEALSINFSDSLPFGLTYIPGSFLYNSIPFPISDIFSDNLPNLGAGASVTLQFKATINQLPESGCTYENNATITYEYISCDGSLPQLASSASVILNVIKNDAKLTAQQLVEQTITALGETVNFSFTFANTGDLDANSVLFTDLLPPGITPNLKTFKVNHIPQLISNLNKVNIGSIAPGKQTLVEFQAIINSFPFEGCTFNNTATVEYEFTQCNGSFNQNSAQTNSIKIQVNQTGAVIIADALVNNSVSINAFLGEVVKFTFNIKNIGDTAANSVRFIEQLPMGLNADLNSLKINGVATPVPSLNDLNIGPILPNASSSVEFLATIESFPAVGHPLNHSAHIAYDYLNCSGTIIKNAFETNRVSIKNFQFSALLIASQLVNGLENIHAKLEDVVTFSFSIKNEGDTNAMSVWFKDLLFQGLNFLTGSFTFNGSPFPDPNLETGFEIGTLTPGETVLIEFQCKIIGFPPKKGFFENLGLIAYQSNTQSGEFIHLETNTNAIRINVEGPSPSNFIGKIKQCKYLNENQYILNAKWKPAPLKDVLFYRIYYKGKVIAEVKPSKGLVFTKCLGSHKTTKDYAVAAVYPGEVESAHIKLRIGHE